MFRNKKGDGKYLSIWWFFCWVLVLVGFLIVTATHSNSLNASYLDAEVLAHRVLDCTVADGELKFSINEIGGFELSECGIELRPINSMELKKDYFLGVEIYESENCKPVGDKENVLLCNVHAQKYFEPAQGYALGNLKERCIRLEGVEVTQMPDCAYKIAYFKQNDKEYILRIVGGTNEN
jgi:hypothetical protein